MDQQLFNQLRAGTRFRREKHGKDISLFKHGRKDTNLGVDLGTEHSRLYVPVKNIDFFNSESHKAKDSGPKEEDVDIPEEDLFDGEKRPAIDEHGSKEEVRKRREQHVEQVSVFRKEQRIHVQGHDIPDPLQSFGELSERFPMKSQLASQLEHCHYNTPTPIQAQAMPVLLHKRELLACAPTGTGKTLAYVLPIFMLLKKPSDKRQGKASKTATGPRALVIAPTLELAEQVEREMGKFTTKKPWKIGLVNSKFQRKLRSPQEQDGKATGGVASVASTSSAWDVLISTPLRLVHLIQEGKLDLSAVEVLIFDEGDQLFDDNFVEQIDAIIGACTHKHILRALFSATLPDVVEELAKTILRDPIRITIGARNASARSIDQKLVYAGSEEGKLMAVRQLFRDGVRPPVLIFVQSIDRAKELFEELMYENQKVDVIHAERTTTQREESVRRFRSGNVWTLICTDILARGVDFKGVSTVINFDVPRSTTTYVHRIGRTGRAGYSGTAITLFTDEDREMLRSIANVMKESGCEVPEYVLAMDKMSKNRRRVAEKRPIKRDTISTKSRYDKRQEKKKEEMIAASKRRVQREKERAEEDTPGTTDSAKKRRKEMPQTENGERVEHSPEVKKPKLADKKKSPAKSPKVGVKSPGKAAKSPKTKKSGTPLKKVAKSP